MFRHIVQSSMRFRALVVALAVIVMAVGIASLDDVPVDVYPEIMPVTVNVQTEALGLSAAEVEQLITVPIEADLLTGTPWVDVMRSESVPGLSSIELTFKPGTDPMHARQVVQERLTQAHALPNVSKPPQMLQPLSSTNRVLLVGLSSKTQSLIEMSVLARWTIRPRLMGVPGVANVAIWGQRERQLQVQVDPERLREENISLIQIVKTAGNALWYSPLSFLESSVAGTGGFIETPNQRLGVRHVLPISVAGDLAKVPVEGTAKTLGQVATVVEDHQPLIGDATNGHGPGLLLVIEKLPGVNALEVTDDIMAALEALKPGLGGIEFDANVYRPAAYIHTAIGNVAKALLVALVLVAAGLLALSHHWRAALVGLAAIPLSLMAAVLVLHATGSTVNMMVLAGLVIALGVVIDDAIHLTHAVLRRVRGGAALPRAIAESASESQVPLGFATVIVLLAALPLLFLWGATGALIQPLVAAYATAILASLLVAALVTPAVTLLLLQNIRIEREEGPFAGWIRNRLDRAPGWMPRAALATLVVAAVIGIALAPRLRVPPAPTFKEPDLMVKWDAAAGTSRAEMNRIIDRVRQELSALPGVANVGAHVGRAILSDQVVGIHSSDLWVSLDSRAPYESTVAAVQDVVAGYPGIDADVTTYLRSRFGDALSGVDEPIVVRLYGQRQEVLEREAEKVRAAIAGVTGVHEPRVHLEDNEPVVEIQVDLQAAKNHGVKPGDVRRAAATLLAGIEVGNLFEEQKVFEVVVWGEPQVRHSVAAIHDLLVDTPSGGHVRLGDVATVRIVPTPHVIQRENVARTLDVVADVQGRDPAAVAAEVERTLGGLSFPLEYRAELVGDYARQEAGKRRVQAVALASAVGILVVLQAALGSWAMALALLVALPLAVSGALVAAGVTGSALSLGSLAGALTVLGIAVRHAVLLVHRCRLLRRQGMEFGPELVRAGTREAAAPILATTALTAAAMLPFAIGAALPGHEILGPMAVVILGGLVTSTITTLRVVPALYARFGAGVLPEAVEDDDLALPSVPEFQRA